METYRQEIKRMVDQCQDERDLWLILRFTQLRVKKE